MADLVDLVLDAPEWEQHLPDLERFVLRVLAEAARAEGLQEVSVCVLLTHDEAMQTLNSRWRERDQPTNVLSFPAASGLAQPGARMLGDLALGWGVVRAEAEKQGKPLADHVAHLLVHGFLHLLGYDHELEAQAGEMESREVAILSGLNVADPYLLQEPS